MINIRNFREMMLKGLKNQHIHVTMNNKEKEHFLEIYGRYH
jgi:hypothetical protein